MQAICREEEDQEAELLRIDAETDELVREARDQNSAILAEAEAARAKRKVSASEASS